MARQPTLLDVIEAGRRISPHVSGTPLHHYPSLDRLIGAEVYVKHENYHPLSSFKIRGAVNVISQLTQKEKLRGVIVASTGNFGQGIAYAARLFGVEANVVVPVDANPGKVDSIGLLGGNIIFHGHDFDESLERAERLATEEGYRYIHSANEPNLIPGVGTYTLEIFQDLPDVDVIIVPVGGGSGACGACVVAGALSPGVQVIGVQAASAPAVYLSWKEGRLAEAPAETVAEGLATRTGYEHTQAILRDMLNDFILVTDEELTEAVVLHLQHTHDLVEHAGAAPLAAAIKIKDRLKQRKVALVMSGDNITIDQLRAALP